MEYIKDFRTKHDWIDRLQQSHIIKKKYPDRVPVIMDRANTYTPMLGRHKFLVPSNLEVGQLIFTLRKELPKLKPEQNLFLFVGVKGNVIPRTNDLMGKCYSENHDRDDHFLYVLYSLENTFGNE